RAPRPAVEASVEVDLDLARVARERLALEDGQLVGALIEREDQPEVELPVHLDEPLATEAGRLAHRAQVRRPSVRAPVIVDRLSDASSVVAKLEGGNVLRHGRRS